MHSGSLHRTTAPLTCSFHSRVVHSTINSVRGRTQAYSLRLPECNPYSQHGLPAYQGEYLQTQHTALAVNPYQNKQLRKYQGLVYDSSHLSLSLRYPTYSRYPFYLTVVLRSCVDCPFQQLSSCHRDGLSKENTYKG
ncbi:hypothetical protein MED222_05925 [Vibrio sp. MED222]|nr:hypothetical protein MED222_05925 [Vibrio sp. MED222]